MANDAKKISDLTVATTLASTDRVVVLYNATTTANVQTITVSNLFQNMPAVTTTSVAIGTIGTANGFLANATSIMVGNSSSNAQIQWNPVDLSIAELSSSQNNFVEAVLWNANTGNNASADFIVNDTTGPGSSNPNYIDVGINGTGFLQSSWTINGPSDAYLYSGGTNLSIGTAGVSPYMNFFTGGTLSTNERMRITSTGNVGIGTTTPIYKLDVSGDARASNVTVIANNGLILGTGTLPTSANGFAYLPNGLIMNWGIFSANTTTAGNAIFSKPFPTAVLSFTATSVVGAFYAYLTAPSLLANAALKSSSTGTGSNVQFIAIGY
jgi:hypothetical protein